MTLGWNPNGETHCHYVNGYIRISRQYFRRDVTVETKTPTNVQSLSLFPVIRHEEIPTECEPRAASGLPRPSSSRVPMFERRRFRQERIRAARLPHLGAYHQRGSHGHAQVETATW